MIRQLSAALLIALACAALCHAQTKISTQAMATVTGHETAEIDGDAVLLIGGKPVLHADGYLITVTTDKADVTLLVRKSLFEPIDATQIGDSHRWRINPPPGDYLIEAWATEPGFSYTAAKLHIGGTIDPTPDPDPDPAKLFKTGWLILIEETAERSPATAAIASNLTYWQGLTARGYKFRFYDVGQVSAETKAWTDKVGLPALLLKNNDGTVFSVLKLPNSVNEIDALLAKPAPAATPFSAPPAASWPAVISPASPVSPNASRPPVWRRVCPGNGQPCQWIQVP